MAPDKQAVALKMLENAASYVGEDRRNDPSEIARFLAVWGLDSSEPFCDAGASWCALKAYCELAGIPFTAEDAVAVFRSRIGPFRAGYWYVSPKCSETQDAASRAGQWLPTATMGPDVTILPGWLVLYSWTDGDQADHIGIVESDGGDFVHTIEFNTSDASQIDGGAVARKVRPYSHVIGFVATYKPD